MSNIEAMEATPLIAVEEQVQTPSTSSSFSTPVRALLAVGAALTLGAVAFLSYGKVSAMPGATQLTTLAVFDGDDFSWCPNHFVQGLTPRTAPDGCILISNQDVFNEKLAPKIVAYTATICTRGSADLSIDSDMLEGLGFPLLSAKGKRSRMLSTISLGHGSTVEIFKSGDFSGISKIITKSSSLNTVKYLDGEDANDNVNSFKLSTKVAGDTWAGKSCQIQFSVCPDIVSSPVVRGHIDEGCVLLSPHDPTSPQYYDTEVKVVRFCAANPAGTVTVILHQQGIFFAHNFLRGS
jgi:hypothetical protein